MRRLTWAICRKCFPAKKIEQNCARSPKNQTGSLLNSQFRISHFAIIQVSVNEATGLIKKSRSWQSYQWMAREFCLCVLAAVRKIARPSRAQVSVVGAENARQRLLHYQAP